MNTKTNRRDFLRQSAVLTATTVILPTLIPSTALGMGGKLAPSDRILMGAIGTGGQGTNNLRDFLGHSKEIQFVAVCDVDSTHTAKAKGIIDLANNNTDCRTYGGLSRVSRERKN
jgi:hypothetical protein